MIEKRAENRSEPPPGYRVAPPLPSAAPGAWWASAEGLADHGLRHQTRESAIAACWEHRDEIVASARQNAGAYLRHVAFEVAGSEVADALLSCAVVLETTGEPEVTP